MLEVSNLVAGYGRLAVLHQVSLRVGEKETVALVGPNGAGKSTLMRTLARQLPVIEGALLFRGEDYGSRDPMWAATHGIALVPQTRNVFTELSVRENLQIGAWRHPEPDRAIQEAQARFPILRERAGQPASALSGGERQILAISCALLARPSLLLLDEPTSGLSPKAAETVMDWVSEIVALNTALIWVVEQMPEPVLRRSHRAYVLEGGQIKFDGPAHDLLSKGRLEELVLQRT